MILSGDPLAAAEQFAERLRLAVESNVIDQPGFRGQITVSIGVATREEPMQRPEELCKAADQQVYRAKEAGRNRICVHRPTKAARAVPAASARR